MDSAVRTQSRNLLQHTLNFQYIWNCSHLNILSGAYILPCLGTASMESNCHVMSDRKRRLPKQLISRAWRAQDKTLFNKNKHTHTRKKPQTKNHHEVWKTRAKHFWQGAVTFLLQRSQTNPGWIFKLPKKTAIRP